MKTRWTEVQVGGDLGTWKRASHEFYGRYTIDVFDLVFAVQSEIQNHTITKPAISRQLWQELT